MGRKSKINYMIEPKLQASIDYLLQTQGTYSPVELLIYEGFLKYEDYEAWRCGEKIYLERFIDGDVELVRQRLRQAVLWLQHLGLQAEVYNYRRWGVNDDGPLYFCESGNEEVATLYQTHFTRLKNNTQQLDLFFDDRVSVVADALRESLLERRSSETKKILDELACSDPGHHFIKPGELFCEAMDALQKGEYGSDVRQDVVTLERYIMPFVQELVGGRVRDVVAPFLSVLSDALAEYPFNDETPKLHRSWVLSELLDWYGVHESILSVKDWQSYPVLYVRLAKALYYMDKRSEAVALWCRLCWYFPDYAEQVMSDPALPDPSVRLAWLEWHDIKVEPALSVHNFPAWLLLNEPGLAQSMKTEEGGAAKLGVESFNLIRKILLAHEEKNRIEKLLVAHGNALKAAHPGLYMLYNECYCRV